MKDTKTKTQVFCKTSYEGIHCYPGAPEPVAYLREPHRHIFGVVVTLDVYDDDREIEFIMLKHDVNNWIKSHLDANGVWQMGVCSCEMVARQLLEYLSVSFTDERMMKVEVNEDGENGAIVWS